MTGRGDQDRDTQGIPCEDLGGGWSSPGQGENPEGIVPTHTLTLGFQTPESRESIPVVGATWSVVLCYGSSGKLIPPGPKPCSPMTVGPEHSLPGPEVHLLVAADG